MKHRLKDPSDTPPPTSPEQAMIERAVGLLLPHAVNKLFSRIETPLRWHETYIMDERQPFNIAVLANLNPAQTRAVTLQRTMSTPKMPDKGLLWTCKLAEPIDEPQIDRATYSMTTIDIYKDRDPKLERVTYWQSNPEDFPGVCVAGEWSFSMTAERYRELVDHVGAALTEATMRLPVEQESFLKIHNYNLAEQCFERNASLQSQAELGLVLATYR